VKPAEDPEPVHLREVRLGLVFNGGVSLAVWMGGVTHEIDSARRANASAADGMAHLWHVLLSTILRQRVRVDIIGGASAGGINGALLATAIATDQPLANLRETWMEKGALATLLREPVIADPPSLLRGDEVLLAAIESIVGTQIAKSQSHPDHPLYLYITATNYHGRPYTCRDATGLEINELDPRHVFSFESIPERFAAASPSAGALRADDAPEPRPVWPSRLAGPTSFEDGALTSRLARAARASSSFPAAFEAAGPYGTTGDYFIDGGILDNQPFGPVLDRLAIMPADDIPVKRVVGYIVPYIDEGRSSTEQPMPDALSTDARPTALGTVAASFKLPRELPKLESLDRLTAAQEAERVDDAQRKLIQGLLGTPDLAAGLPTCATALFTTYQQTRIRATDETFARWSDGSFVPGSGRLGQDPTIAVSGIVPGDPVASIGTLEQRPWIARERDWPGSRDVWTWGLSPAERVATWALLCARDALDANPGVESLVAARRAASRMVWDIRTLKRHLSENFAWPAEAGLSLASRAQRAYEELVAPVAPELPALAWLQAQFVELDKRIAEVGGQAPIPSVQTLLHLEVVRNALASDTEGAPFPFEFLFMSARIANSLGHPFATPDAKLAGMKLGHFGGFVKSSWRANDWLWGRLDGVEHVLRVTFDRAYLEKLSVEGATDLAAQLAGFAFPAGAPGAALSEQWEARAGQLTPPLSSTSTPARFAEALNRAIANADPAALELCRTALAARIQLAILDDELPRLADAARNDVQKGFNPNATGAVWARSCPVGPNADPEGLVASFRTMPIGSERINGELNSRGGAKLVRRVLAVTRAMLAGTGGGVPPGERWLPRWLLSGPLGAVLKWFGLRKLRKHAGS
jgi:predicted acylesterase/phospholipase RssA